MTDTTITMLNNLIYFGLGLGAGLIAAQILIRIECVAINVVAPRLTPLWWAAILIAVLMVVPAFVVLTVAS